MNPFLGQIQPFGFNFAPRNWALCKGDLLPIAQYTALFSLLGTIYGGDGRTTFGLPDLRGRVSLKDGRGPGLTPYQIGEKGGSPTVALTDQQIPSHDHLFQIVAEAPNQPKPTGGLLGTPATPIYSNAATPDAALKSSTIGSSGGGQGHENMEPYIVVNWCIALVGVYPPRS